MQLVSLLAAAAALATAQAKIALTHFPTSAVQVGKPFTISWSGADPDKPVTITLKEGDPNDLQTVALLTGQGKGKTGSFEWTPSKSLPEADDYALEIMQGLGQDEYNFSGLFAIKGGSSHITSGYSTVTMTSGSSTYVTSHASYPVATTGTGGSGNGTLAHTTRTPKPTSTGGGIQVSGGASTTEGSPSSGSSSAVSPSSSGAAAHLGPVGGVAAALLGFAALL